MYVDSTFIYDERIREFCKVFEKNDKKLYENKDISKDMNSR
jgi:hypothetical protein